MDRSITHLELRLIEAKKGGLIVDYEHILYRDYIVVRFLPETDEATKYKIRTHIRDTYSEVQFVTFGNVPNQDYMYIKYHLMDY